MEGLKISVRSVSDECIIISIGYSNCFYESERGRGKLMSRSTTYVGSLFLHVYYVAFHDIYVEYFATHVGICSL